MTEKIILLLSCFGLFFLSFALPMNSTDNNFIHLIIINKSSTQSLYLENFIHPLNVEKKPITKLQIAPTRLIKIPFLGRFDIVVKNKRFRIISLYRDTIITIARQGKEYGITCTGLKDKSLKALPFFVNVV